MDEEDSEESEEDDEDVEEELVLENGHTPTPQDIRARFLAATGVGYDESDDPELEYSDTVGNEVECAVSNTQDEEEEDEDELLIVEEDGPVQPRFSETGELFSDGGDMSDIVELPATDSETNDELPVKELSSENILTVEDLPCKLNIPGPVPSYRDAVVGSATNSGTLPTPSLQPATSSPLPTSLTPAESSDKPASQLVSETQNAAAAATAAAATNGPDTLDAQAVLEVLGDSTLVGDDSTIIPPP